MRTHTRWTGGGSTAVRITPQGPYFYDPDGKIVFRRSITAFTAPKRFATGNGDDAKRYLDFAAEERLNEVRAFTRVDWTGPPGIGIEPGWQYNEAACEELLVEAAARGLHVELTAHTGKYGTVQEMADHLRRVDELCLAYQNAILDCYNEPQQNGGHELLQQIFNIYTPKSVGWASGCYDPTPYTLTTQVGTDPNGNPILGRAGGTVGPCTLYHSPRKADWPRCFKDVFEFSNGQGPNCQFVPGYPGAVVLDEPPRMEENLVPADWEAYGAGARLFAAGVTAHSIPFQKCEVPTDALLECVRALVRGIEAVPEQRYHGYAHGDDQGSLRRYRRWGDDGKCYEISVRPYEFKQV